MTKRPTKYCDVCESLVYADDVHSCHDAKRVRSVAEAERKVLTLAERLVDAYSNELGAGMAMTTDKEREKAKLRTGVVLVALYHGVEELRRVREQGAG